MKAIVAVDNNWAIGKGQDLLFHIKEDLKRFKNMTTGKVVVMGRKTFDSLPNRRPLPNRTNIVLTKNIFYNIPGAEVLHSVHEFLYMYPKKYNEEDIFIIGGSKIYNEFMDYIDDVYVTKIYASVDGADKYFQNLDSNKKFEIVDESDIFNENGLEYQFIHYKRIK